MRYSAVAMVRRRRWVLAGLLLLTLGPVPLVGWLGDRGLRSLEERHAELARAETLAELGEELTGVLAELGLEPFDAVPPLARGALVMPLRSDDPSEDPTGIALAPAGEALSHPEAMRAARLAGEGRVGEALEVLGGLMRDADPRHQAVGFLQAAEVMHNSGRPERAVDLARRAEAALAQSESEAWPRWARASRMLLEGDRYLAEEEAETWVEAVCERPTDLEELVLLGQLLGRLPDPGPAEADGVIWARAGWLDERRAWPRWRRLLLPRAAAMPPVSPPTLLPTPDGWFLVRGDAGLSALRVVGLGSWLEAWRGDDGASAHLPGTDARTGSALASRVRLSALPGATRWPIDLGDLEVEVIFAKAQLFGAWNPRFLLFAALFAYAALGLLALRALLAQERQARRLATARGDLIAEVTHELRTPLTVLRMYAESLAGERVPPEAEREYLNTIQRESIRLGELVDRVAEAAREEEVSPTEARVLDPGPIVERVARDFGELIEKDGGSVRFEAQGDAARVRGDEEELRRIVEILLDNAVRYSLAPARVEIGARVEEDRWICTIRDHGPGLPEDEPERLFERWVRGKSAPGRGAGMGLYLARRGAGTLGGVLTLETPESGGTRARLELPLCVEGNEGGDDCHAS